MKSAASAELGRIFAAVHRCSERSTTQDRLHRYFHSLCSCCSILPLVRCPTCHHQLVNFVFLALAKTINVIDGHRTMVDPAISRVTESPRHLPTRMLITMHYSTSMHHCRFASRDISYSAWDIPCGNRTREAYAEFTARKDSATFTGCDTRRTDISGLASTFQY